MALAAILREVSQEAPHGLDVDRIADETPLSRCDQKSGLFQFLEMKRGSGCSDTCGFRNLRRCHARRTDLDQHSENAEPVLLRERR